MRLLLALVAACSFAVQAEDLPHVDFSHHDWQLACDNTRTCRAAGYQAEGEEPPMSVLLTREAGPRRPVEPGSNSAATARTTSPCRMPSS